MLHSNSITIPDVIHFRKHRRSSDIWLFVLFLTILLLLHSNGFANETRHKKQQTIKGTVVDEHNQPVVGARVFIESRDWFEIDKPNLETTTDEKGRFTLTDEPLHIEGQTLQAKDSQNRMAQLSLPYPSQKHLKQPDLNQLRLQLKPPRRVELEVFDDAGKPVPAALAGIMDLGKTWGIGRTDSAGKIEFRVPHDTDLKYAIALRDGYGADYRAYGLKLEESIQPDAKPPKFPDHPVQLTLDGAQPVKIKLESAEGKPLSGIDIEPLTPLFKPDQPLPMPLMLMFYTTRQLVQTTDGTGTIVFAWIPHWQKQRMYFGVHNKEYIPHRFVYEPAKDKGAFKVQLKPKKDSSEKATFP